MTRAELERWLDMQNRIYWYGMLIQETDLERQIRQLDSKISRDTQQSEGWLCSNYQQEYDALFLPEESGE